MQLNIQDNHSEACKAAARAIADQLREKSDLVIGLATGNTMEPIYDELVRMQKEERLDFSKAHFVQLDEFKGVPPEDKHSFNFAVHTLFLDKIGARDDQKHLIDGTNFNPAAFEKEIKELGGVDVQLLGVGREGHIGFNEANANPSLERSGEVTLAATTIEDSAAHWGGKANVPQQAYTQGVGTIMDAKHIIMIVNGGHKAKIAKDMLSDGSKEELPARALLDHPSANVFMDKPATELLTDEQLKNYASMDSGAIAAHREHFQPIHIELDDGKALDLPYNADVYLPGVMDIDEKFDPANAKHVDAFQEMLANVKETYVGAHQDDAELWAPNAIEANLQAQQEGKPSQFLPIIVTDGAAYTTALERSGKYADLTPEQLIEMRKAEQRKAANSIPGGSYPVIQLQYPSNTVKKYLGAEKQNEVVDSLRQIYDVLPKHETAYLHHPSDIHKTHVASVAIAVEALRQTEHKPKKAVSMLAWGGGVSDEILAVKDPTIVNKLLQEFKSQIEMQKRGYAENGEGNVRANGFMLSPHAHPGAQGAVLGMDITDAVTDGVSLRDIRNRLEAFKRQLSDQQIDDFAPDGSIENQEREGLAPEWSKRLEYLAGLRKKLDNGPSL